MFMNASIIGCRLAGKNPQAERNGDTLWDLRHFRKPRATIPKKDAGRRNECYDGLLFPPERDNLQQVVCQLLHGL
jgi:hypothetical protein